MSKISAINYHLTATETTPLLLREKLLMTDHSSARRRRPMTGLETVALLLLLLGTILSMNIEMSAPGGKWYAVEVGCLLLVMLATLVIMILLLITASTHRQDDDDAEAAEKTETV